MKSIDEGTIVQKIPIEGDDVVLNYVCEDLINRSKFGEKKYGTVLKTHNGRDALVDAYQEQLDNIVYTKQLIMERDEELELLFTSYNLISKGDPMSIEDGINILERVIRNRLPRGE